jgi:hypothetical protein
MQLGVPTELRPAQRAGPAAGSWDNAARDYGLDDGQKIGNGGAFLVLLGSGCSPLTARVARLVASLHFPPGRAGRSSGHLGPRLR